MRDERSRPEKRDADMARDQVVDRLAGTAVGHVVELDTGELPEPLQQHVLVRARARRRAAKSRLPLRRLDQFCDRAHRQRRMHGQRKRLSSQLDDGHEFVQIVDTGFQDMRSACHIVVGDENRIAIGRALDRRLDADCSARPGAVLDDDLLADCA